MGMFAVVGALVGGVAGVTSVVRKSSVREAEKRALPSRVMQDDAFRDSLLTLVSVPKTASKRDLHKVVQYCNALLYIQGRVEAAAAETVSLSVAGEAVKAQHRLKAHLRRFYDNSGISLRSNPDTKTLEPMNVELRGAHTTLLTAVEAVLENIQEGVTHKNRAAIADRAS